MSQTIFTSINPNTTSGTQLATILNNFKDACVSGNSGTARPSALQAGGTWVDLTNDPTSWTLKFYTGTVDIPVYTVDLSSGSVSISTTNNIFEIIKNTDDAVGAILKFFKGRPIGNQTLDGDVIGELDFYGNRDTGVETAQARITVKSSDNVTSSAQGSYFIFEATNDGASSVSEWFRMVDGKFGVGVTAPDESIHVKGNIKTERNSDDAVGAKHISKKKRVTGVGQVQASDVIFQQEFHSADNTGADIETARIEVTALETHTSTAQGTGWKLKTKKTGSATFTDRVTVTSATVDIPDLTVGSVSNTEIGYLDGVTSAIQTQLNSKATPADITTAVANLVNSAPTTLDTLKELADAINDDPNYAATINTALGNRFRVDTNAQALSGTQKTNAKTNIDLQNVDNTSDTTKNSAVAILTNKTIDRASNTMTNLNIVNADVAAGAAIARSKLANGTNNAMIVNSGAGVMSEATDMTVGTNNFTLANTKHIEVQAATDSTTTGANASLTAFTGGGIRLTNASLTSLSNIPAGANGQKVTIFNRTGATVNLIDSVDAVGTANDRILTGTGATVSFANNSAMAFEYDSTTARWQVVGGTGSGSGQGGINYVTNYNAESGVTGWATYNDTDTATMTIASPAVVTVTSTTKMFSGMPFTFTTSGALPTGVTAGTTYYVTTIVSGTTFRFSATLGGADVITTGSQSGTHTFRPFVPLDGTGGSASITFTRTTSSPLRGVASFLLTKGASNLAGEGVSYDITIDTSDKGKVLQSYVEYFIASGTFADNDVAMWIYNITDGVLIQPAPYLIKNSALVEKFFGEFQSASTSTSYRLIFHVSSASSTAYTVKMDNVSVGPQGKLFGSPKSDLKLLPALTVTAVTSNPTKGTVVLDRFWAGRDGQFLEGIMQYQQSAIGAAGSGEYIWTLPAGYVFDTSIITPFNGASVLASAGALALAHVGVGSMTDASIETIVRLYAYSSTQFRAMVIGANGQAATAQYAISSAQMGFVESASLSYHFNIRAPMQGWGSSQVVSNDADTRVVSASCYRSTGASVTSGSQVNFDSILLDTHGGITSGASWKYTIPVAGNYQINTIISTTSPSTAFQYLVYKNGSSLGYLSSNHGSGFGGEPVSGSMLIPNLVAGDFIDIRPNSTQTVAGSSAPYQTKIDIFRLSGPAQIAASETVSASYWVSANFAASATVPINFDSKEFDSHGAVVPSSTVWKFTAPISGIYSIQGFTETSTAGSPYYHIYKNGVIYKLFNRTQNGFGDGACGTTIKLLAGEYIDFRPNGSFTVVGGTLSATGGTNISITRVGNY